MINNGYQRLWDDNLYVLTIAHTSHGRWMRKTPLMVGGMVTGIPTVRFRHTWIVAFT